MAKPEPSKSEAAGRQAVVSLTYDGGDLSHIETVAPCLQASLLRGTFYVPPERFLLAPDSWRKIYRQGNEIGNYSLAEGASPEGYLLDWTPQMIANDLELSEGFYAEVLPSQIGHSFAYPCKTSPHTRVGSMSIQDMQHYAMIRPVVRSFFRVARTSVEGMNSLERLDLTALKCYHAEDQTHEDWIALVESAQASGSWLILAFHGVGSGNHAVDALEHARFCLWLANHRDQVRVETVWNVGKELMSSAHAAVESPTPSEKEASKK